MVVNERILEGVIVRLSFYLFLVSVSRPEAHAHWTLLTLLTRPLYCVGFRVQFFLKTNESIILLHLSPERYLRAAVAVDVGNQNLPKVSALGEFTISLSKVSDVGDFEGIQRSRLLFLFLQNSSRATEVQASGTKNLGKKN